MIRTFLKEMIQAMAVFYAISAIIGFSMDLIKGDEFAKTMYFVSIAFGLFGTIVNRWVSWSRHEKQ